jgi:hypothetical protein
MRNAFATAPPVVLYRYLRSTEMNHFTSSPTRQKSHCTTIFLLRMTNSKRTSAPLWAASCFALLRVRIGNRVDANDGGVQVVVAENLAKIGPVGGHGFCSRLA